MTYILLSTLPFIVAVILIIWKEEPILPLILSIFMALWLFNRLNPITAFLEIIGSIVANFFITPENALLIITITEVLILFYLFREGGHLKGLINTKQFKKLSKYSLEYILFGFTFLLSFEERLSSLISGVFLKSFVKEKNISRKKFAFIINNIGPIFYTLVPLTLFTPIITKIIGGSITPPGIDYPALKIYLHSLPFQFYNIFTLIIIASSVILKKDIRPISNISIKSHPDDSSAVSMDKNDKKNNIQPLVIAPDSRIRTKSNTTKSSLYSAGISFGIAILALISTAIILIIKFYDKNPIDVIFFQRIFTSCIFGGIIYYIIYSLIFKSISIRELSSKLNINSSTLVVIFYIILSSSLFLLAKRLDFYSKFTLLIFNDNKINPAWYPLIFFVISSVLSFLTGSRLAVLYIIIPIAFKIISSALPDPLIIDYSHYAVLGAIISGSSFGVINSPLSPIFIISSASSEISIKKHFTSQIFYSIGALILSVITGYMLSFFKISPYLSISIGLILVSAFFTFSRNFLVNI